VVPGWVWAVISRPRRTGADTIFSVGSSQWKVGVCTSERVRPDCGFSPCPATPLASPPRIGLGPPGVVGRDFDHPDRVRALRDRPGRGAQESRAGAAQRAADPRSAAVPAHRHRPADQSLRQPPSPAGPGHRVLLRHPALRDHNVGTAVRVVETPGRLRTVALGAGRLEHLGVGRVLVATGGSAPIRRARHHRHAGVQPHPGHGRCAGSPATAGERRRGHAQPARRLVAVVRGDDHRYDTGLVPLAGVPVPGMHDVRRHRYRQPLSPGRGRRNDRARRRAGADCGSVVRLATRLLETRIATGSGRPLRRRPGGGRRVGRVGLDGGCG
jgi:hypothetical protein